MINIKVDRKYIIERYGELPEENIENMINAMSKYDTPWWESKDPKIIAKYQIDEDVLLVENFGEFRDAVNEVVGEDIPTLMYAFGRNKVKQLIEEALKRYEQ